MSGYAILFVVLIVGGTILLSLPLGGYMKWAMDPALPDAGAAGRFTRLFQRFGGRFARGEQDWKRYLISLLVFNVIMFGVCFAILALQQYLPLNPDDRGALNPDLIFNTAASFTTNTNLQHYSGEVSLSYLSQLAALMWLQFVSAATGIAALTALARGLAGRKGGIGNFFMDVQRATFLVLLPLALVVATLMVLLGTADDLRRLGSRDDARRRDADHRARTGRGIRRHQAARHQWWRILRPEQHASFREPDLLDQCDRDDRDHSHPDGVRVAVRPHHRPHAACRGGVRRDAGIPACQDRPVRLLRGGADRGLR